MNGKINPDKKKNIFLAFSEKKYLPYLALVVAVFATSIGGLFIRWANAPGTVTVFYRTALSTIIVAPFFMQSLRSSEQSSSVILRWIPFAILGGVLIAFDQAAWATALLMTKMANTTYFNSIAPLWVAMFALVVFKEKLNFNFWIGLVLALGGTLVIIGLDLIYRPHLGLGDLIGLLSSFFYGGYFLVTQIGRRHLNTLTYTWIATFTCAVCLGIINLIMGIPITGYSYNSYLFFLGAAITSQVIGYFSMSFALGHLPASIVSPSMLAKPIVVAVMAFIFFAESMTFGEIIGGILVLLGIFLINRNEVRLNKVQV